MSDAAGSPNPVRVNLTPNWTITLHDGFRQEMRGETLHLQEPGLSIWVTCFGTQDGSSVAARMARDAARAPANASAPEQSLEGGLGRVSYVVPPEPGNPPKPPLFYTYTHAPESQLMMAFYHTGPAMLAKARAYYATLTYRP